VGIELAEVPDLDLDAGAGGPELTCPHELNQWLSPG
jgi:hypothetical protein